MDPLQPPLISKYEWEYKNDINQRMRVPDKISVASSLPELGSTRSPQKDVDYPDQTVANFEQREQTPGYSPDLLTDGVAEKTPSVHATASASASATVHVTSRQDPSTAATTNTTTTTLGRSNLDRLRVTESRLSHVEAYVSRLSSRLHAVEQQQAVMSGLISIYLGLKFVRFLVSVLLK